MRPKSFAGLFGAAPSIALATLLITLAHKDVSYVALEGRSMVLGAIALGAYSCAVCLLLKKYLMPAWLATLAAFSVWLAVAFGLACISFGSL